MNRMQCGVEKILTVKIGLIAGLFVRNRLQPRRQRLVPFPSECRDVTEDFHQACFADVAGERHRVESRSAYRRIRKQRIDIVGVFSPALRQTLVFHHR